MNDRKALKIRQCDDFTGEAWLYRLFPPYTRWETSYDYELVEYVVASAVVGPGGLETLVFASDAEGSTDCSCVGGERGYLDCDKAIQNMGYEIVEGN